MFLYYCIYFTLLVFFWIKMSYAGSHFTGASQTLPIVYTLYGLAALCSGVYLLIRYAIKYSIIGSLAILCIGYFIAIQIGILINKQIYNELSSRQNPVSQASLAHALDISATKIAFWGLFVVPYLIYVMYNMTR